MRLLTSCRTENPEQTHFVFIAADDELRDKAPRFLAQLSEPANVSFATLSDFFSGFPSDSALRESRMRKRESKCC